MRSRLLRFGRRSLVGAVALSGCVSVQSPPSSRLESAAYRFEKLRDSVRLASALEHDEVAAAPRIRLVIPPTSMAGSPYVEASFHLSADAYVLVVAVDRDRRVRVIHPETPEQSGFAAQREPHRLTRFFAGFGRAGGFARLDARYDISQRISPVGGVGVLLAVASDRPLQLERLTDAEGEWDEPELMRLVFEQSLPEASRALGRAVVLTGQEFNSDYTTFSGSRTLASYRSFASSRFGACDTGFGYGLSDAFEFSGSGFGSGVVRFLGFYTRNGQTFARYSDGGCGVTVYDVPVPSQGRAPSAPPPPDTTTVARRGPRFPGAPRFPSAAGDSGTGPLARRLTPPQADDRARERPLVAAGLRFRPPDQLPSEAPRPLEARMSPRERDASPARPEEQSPPREWSRERRTEPAREAAARAEPVQREPVRSEPVRSEPVRSEPVRSEPVRSEPVRSEPVRREPTAPAPRPITPT